ncbi:MAG: hypothetical protein ABSF62_02735 [Bryobacteraceae bacterium]
MRASVLPRILSFLILFAMPSRAADPIVVSGATADGLAIPTTTAAVSYPIVLHNTSNAAIGIRVEITDFVGPDSQLYTATLKDPANAGAAAGPSVTLNLPALQTKRLMLETTAPLAGTYQSSIDLIYAKVGHPISLKITRTSVAPTVKVNGLDAAAFEGGGTRSFRFSIQETSGAKVTLRPPAISAFSVKSADKTLQAAYDSAKAYRVNPDGSETKLTSPFDVDGWSAAVIRMEIAGLTAPGEYTAAIDIGSRDAGLPSQTFSIFVKRSALLAALLIAIGVGFSTLIRRYTRIDRPRLLLRRKILLLDSDIEVMRSRLPDAPDGELLGALSGRLRRADAEIDLGNTSVDDVLNDVNAKLTLVPDWSNLRKKIEATQPPAVADPFRPILQAARELILANANATAQQIQDTGTALRKARTDLDAAVRQKIVDQVTAIQVAVKDTPPALSDVHKEDFAAQVTAVLAQAVNAANQSPPDVAKAGQLIDQARRAAARIMVNDLGEKLVQPDELSQDVWGPLESRFQVAAAKVRAATTGDQAMSAYQDADAAWLAAMIEAATSQAKAVKDRAAASQDPEKQAFAAKMQQALSTLSTARNSMAAGDLKSGRVSYNTVKPAIADGLAALPPAPRPRAMDADTTARSPRRIFSLFGSSEIIQIPGLSASSPVETTAERQLRPFRDIRSIEKEIARRDRWVASAVGIAAVILGVFLLWVDNLTWGTAKDMIAAVLWGLGLHQVAGNALFSKLDLGALESQLTGAAAPAAGGNAQH